MDELLFLSDVTAPPDEELPTSRIQVGKLGRFVHPRWGKSTWTQQTFAGFVRNFRAGSGRIPVDLDHAPDRGGPTEAAGWITDLHPEGDKLFASVEWTKAAAQKIRDRAYMFISPTFVMNGRDEGGNAVGPKLVGAALTNRPFLERMAAVSLSTFSFATEEDAPASEEGDTPPPEESCPRCKRPMSDCRCRGAKRKPVADSRQAQMDFLPEIAQLFGLDAEATEDQVLTAAREAAEKVPAEGQIVMTADAVTDLTRKANAGEAAANEVKEMRFTALFSQAITDGKVGDGQRDHFHQLYEDNEETTTALLASLQPVVSTAPKGTRGDDTEAPEGVLPDSFDADRQVRAYMAEHSIADYGEAAHQLFAGAAA